MQYNLEEFNDYLKEYLGMKERIEETKNILDDLLHDDKLKKTLDFYNNLDKEGQKKFNEINCNMGFVRYKLNEKKLEELEKGLSKLYKDFIDSEAFPFSKDEFHFFVSNDTYLVDAINGEDSSDLSDEENRFLYHTITNVYCYDPHKYSEDDIPLIKVLYLRNKDNYNDKDKSNIWLITTSISLDINMDALLAKENDKNSFAFDKHKCNYVPLWKIKLWGEKLYNQQEIVLNSDSKNKALLLFSIRSAFYELELLSGTRVTDVLEQLENMEAVNQHQERKKEYEIEALIKAYYNLIDINFRENSNYFSDDDYKVAKFETADPKINKRLLKMIKR